LHREPERPQRCVFALDAVEGGHAEGLVRGRIGVGGQQVRLAKVLVSEVREVPEGGHAEGLVRGRIGVGGQQVRLAKVLVSEVREVPWTKVYYAGRIWRTRLRS
jgi:hypothetical protein